MGRYPHPAKVTTSALVGWCAHRRLRLRRSTTGRFRPDELRIPRHLFLDVAAQRLQ